MLSTSSSDTIPNTDLFPNTGELPGAGPFDSVPAPARRHNDERNASWQAVRVRRLLLVCFVAELYLLALAVFHSQHLVERGTLIYVSSATGAAIAGFYCIFASGLNLKAGEKNLAAPIALTALAIMLWTLYAAPASRIIFTPFSFMLVAYAMYRLTQRTILLLCAAILSGYAVVVGMHWMQKIAPQDFTTALLHWLVLALTLPGFTVLTGRVRRLHSALRLAGMKIRNIEEHAQRDQLLGCYNRRYVIAALEEQKRFSDENGAPLCLAVIDLDHFKSINDEVGHLAGDEVLRTFTRIAQDNIRQGDVFGRYGGEEFVLVLPQTPLLPALNTAERIREQVEHHGWQGVRNVTVSIGLTQYIPGESVLNLFSRTDTAMYLAKRGGRNQVVVEEPNPRLWQTAEVA
jgi:diguanylate cyclase (GGDEF)-like protein